MSKVSIKQFSKLMVDEKVGKILKVTKDSEGITTKQISKATKIPNNQLYYTLNKMIDADLLKIVKQVQVKNLTESYYSSSFLNKQPKYDTESSDSLDFSDEWVMDHAEETMQFLMLQHHEFLDALKIDLDNGLTDPVTTASHSEYELSPEGEKQLMSDLFKVLNQAHENDPDPDSKEKRVVRVQLEKW